MEKFTKLFPKMTVHETEIILKQKLKLIEIRENHFIRDIAEFKEAGVTLFFNPEKLVLETIKYQFPFPFAIDNVKIGDTINDVENKKGIPTRKNPFPTQESIIYTYGSLADQNSNWCRFDFDKRNKRCHTIFK